jgi:pilus assembly protein CpaC
VRVAEASRTAIRSLGINAVHAGNDFFGGSTVGGNPNNIDLGLPEDTLLGHDLPFTINNDTFVNPNVTLLAGFPGIDFQMFISALIDNQYMRLLAEPTLVAISGEEASFLAGGEFPIPIVQGSNTAGTSITVQYKEFGVRLRFRPTVLGDNSIRLVVAPEVSDITDVGAVVIQGFSIPAITTRRAETTLEMHSGQTFAMAGLIDRTSSARVQKVPGLGNVPVLGSLFRSVRYETGDTELLVLVTVALVEPISSKQAKPLPGDAHIAPSDWELFSEGDIEGKVGPRISQADAEWFKAKGLDRLEGPGAWATYEQPPAPKPTTPATRTTTPPASMDEPAPAPMNEGESEAQPIEPTSKAIPIQEVPMDQAGTNVIDATAASK